MIIEDTQLYLFTLGTVATIIGAVMVFVQKHAQFTTRVEHLEKQVDKLTFTLDLLHKLEEAIARIEQRVDNIDRYIDRTQNNNSQK